MTPSVGIGAYPSRQGLPDVSIGGGLGYFQVPTAGGCTFCMQKWSSLWTEIVLWRHVTYDESESLDIGSVRTRAVDDRMMMQRHIAGSQDKIDRIGLIDLDLDLFASLQKVVRAVRFLMG